MSSTAFVNGSTLSDAGWANDVDTFVYSRLTSVSGTNTVVGTGPVSMTVYATGQRFTFIPAATNTGATTLNITPSGGSALGAKNIFWNGAACVGGEIRIGVPCEIFYDGTQFNLIAQPTSRVFGTTTNDSAAAGFNGEVIESVIVGGGAVALVNNTPANITSISLTAGDWDVTAHFALALAASTQIILIQGCSNTTSATVLNPERTTRVNYGNVAPGSDVSYPVPSWRYSLSATTTVYLVVQAAFSVSTCSGYGYLRARRAR